MTTFEIIVTIVIAILWINCGIRSIVSMNTEDGDAIGWGYVHPAFKVFYVIIAPLMMLIYDRHIFYSK